MFEAIECLGLPPEVCSYINEKLYVFIKSTISLNFLEHVECSLSISSLYLVNIFKKKKSNTLSCKDAMLPRESGVCDRRCTDSESTWSTGVRGNEGGVAVGRGGAGPLRDDVEPKKRFYM